MSNHDVLQEILDRNEIVSVVLHYARGLDLKNWEMFRSCWVDEVDTDFSSYNGNPPAVMKADDITMFARKNVTGLITQHLSTNHIVTVEGSSATCTSSLFAQHRRPGQEETEYYDMHGDYTYTLVRTANGWKIRGIKMDMRWQEGNPQLLGSGEG